MIDSTIKKFIVENQDLIKEHLFPTLYDRALDKLQGSSIGLMTKFFLENGVDPLVLGRYKDGRPMDGIPDSYFNSYQELLKYEVLPNIRCIGESAFSHSGLYSCKLHNGLKTIESYAFYYCKNLVNIVIPDTVESIGGYAFCHSGLQDITLSGNLKLISPGTFKYCEHLHSIVIPSSVKHISANAFADCPEDLVVYYDNNNIKIAAELQGMGVKHEGIK